jgi:hypothetical protein
VAIANNLKDSAIEAIGDYLIAAKMCIDTRKPNGSILGYPAALLLLCATDAIGQAVLPPDKKQNIRLDVLAEPPFGLMLKPEQIDNLKDWYRNWLAHSGLIAPSMGLTPDADGEPFDFDPTSGALRFIRVPVFYAVVRDAWKRLDETTFKPVGMRKQPENLTVQQREFLAGLGSAASGVIFPPRLQSPGGKP